MSQLEHGHQAAIADRETAKALNYFLVWPIRPDLPPLAPDILGVRRFLLAAKAALREDHCGSCVFLAYASDDPTQANRRYTKISGNVFLSQTPFQVWVLVCEAPVTFLW